MLSITTVCGGVHVTTTLRVAVTCATATHSPRLWRTRHSWWRDSCFPAQLMLGQESKSSCHHVWRAVGGENQVLGEAKELGSLPPTVIYNRSLRPIINRRHKLVWPPPPAASRHLVAMRRRNREAAADIKPQSGGGSGSFRPLCGLQNCRKMPPPCGFGRRSPP